MIDHTDLEVGHYLIHVGSIYFVRVGHPDVKHLQAKWHFPKQNPGKMRIC